VRACKNNARISIVAERSSTAKVGDSWFQFSGEQRRLVLLGDLDSESEEIWLPHSWFRIGGEGVGV
jgi:hypothetical protein